MIKAFAGLKLSGEEPKHVEEMGAMKKKSVSFLLKHSDS